MRVLEPQTMSTAVRPCRQARGFSLLFVAAFAVAALGAETGRAQNASFASYYGDDPGNRVYEPRSMDSYSYADSRQDAPYQSHFGPTRPAAYHGSAPPSEYEFGMDADSLYASAAAQGTRYPPHASQIYSPPIQPQYFLYYMPAPAAPTQQAAPALGGANGLHTLSALTPGADWQVEYANFQDDEATLDVPPLPPGEAGAEAADADGDPRFGEQQQERVAQIVESPLAVLRTQSVLLDKGERQIDVALVYTIADGILYQPVLVSTPGPNTVVVSPVRARQRLLIAPIEFRYGLTDNIQTFCNMPFGWADSELAIPGLIDEWGNRAGIGDVNFGATALLHQGCGDAPDVLGTLDVTAPTGDADYFITGGTPNSRLGEGFWAISTSVLCVQTLDPCVLFYGLGYRHRFDANFMLNVHANPGEQFIYQLGVGFAASESVTLSTSFLGVYTTEDHINGQRVQGGITEPMRLRFSATIAKPCKIVEPFAEIGMTRDAANARIGITWTY